MIIVLGCSRLLCTSMYSAASNSVGSDKRGNPLILEPSTVGAIWRDELA